MSRTPRLAAVARRRFVATLAATATALGLMTAAAVPARAETDAETVAKWVAGLAVLAIIADAVEDDRKDKARPAPHPVAPDWRGVNRHPPRSPQSQPAYPAPAPIYRQPVHPPYPQGHGWGHPQRPPVVVTPVRPPVRVEPQLPRRCRVEVQGIRGEDRAYVESCLRGQGFHDRLPRHCATEVTIRGYADRVYGANCLADEGLHGRHKRRN